MAKTAAEIARRALVMIGKLPLGQTPTSAQENDMLDAFNSVDATLRQDGLAQWASGEPIPDQYVDSVVALVASERAEGIPPQRYQRVLLRADGARREIAKLNNGPYVSSREYADY